MCNVYTPTVITRGGTPFIGEATCVSPAGTLVAGHEGKERERQRKVAFSVAVNNLAGATDVFGVPPSAPFGPVDDLIISTYPTSIRNTGDITGTFQINVNSAGVFAVPLRSEAISHAGFAHSLATYGDVRLVQPTVSLLAS